MFVGHYAASLALKKVDPSVSLGTLFLAVQFVDILFFPLVLLGIEQLNIVENFTESTHFELVFMPYTHSLLATFIWAGLAFVGFRFLRGTASRAALVIALGVASHWFLDLLVHTPDLPLWSDNSIKLGFGLWNNAVLTFVLEAGLLLIGLVLYLQATRTQHQNHQPFVARLGVPLFVAFLILANAINVFGPLTDTNVNSFALIPLTLYFVFAGVAYYLDHRRSGANRG